MDLLHCGHCPYLGADSTDSLCKLSEYLYTEILHDWTSKESQDKDISCYQTLNRSQDIDIHVLVDTGWITGQITRQSAGYSGQT